MLYAMHVIAFLHLTEVKSCWLHSPWNCNWKLLCEARDHLWRKGSKPLACRFLDIELEYQIGKRGFRVAKL